jgi:hypothetical protein
MAGGSTPGGSSSVSFYRVYVTAQSRFCHCPCAGDAWTSRAEENVYSVGPIPGKIGLGLYEVIGENMIGPKAIKLAVESDNGKIS